MTEKHPLDDADLVEFGDGEDFQGDLEDDFEDDDFSEDEDFAEEEDFTGDGADLKEDGGDADPEEEDEEDDDDVPLPAEEEEDDDDEDLHPSDVEADLEEILRDRIAASDDDEEDEEEEAAGQPKTASVVAPPRSDEWTCNQCFLIVSVTQFGSRANPVCPSGEDPCESIERIFRG